MEEKVYIKRNQQLNYSWENQILSIKKYKHFQE